MAVTLNANTSTGFIATSDTSGVLQLQTAGTTAVTVDASQNVGIGTASPAYKLDVTGTIRGRSDQYFGWVNGSQAGVWWAQTNYAVPSFQGLTSAGNVGDIVMQLGGANVGIGTASPTRRLHVKSTDGVQTVLETTGASAGLQAFTNAGSSTVGAFDFTSSAMIFYTGAGTSGAAERMRIDSSGNVVVGATAAINGAKLTVQSTNSAGIATGYGTTAGQWRRMYVETTNNNLYFYNGSNEGYLNTAGAWINASDERLKNSIVDIKYGLSAVMNTQPRSYKMNDLDGDYVGFVAQELQLIIPEVVSGNPERQLGVDYGSLVAVAFKAIQEQQALITQLQADVAALKGATP